MLDVKETQLFFKLKKEESSNLQVFLTDGFSVPIAKLSIDCPLEKIPEPYGLTNKFARVLLHK